MAVSAKEAVSNEIRATRVAIEESILEALNDHHGAVIALAMRNVEVGRLLITYRATFDLEGVTAKDASAAFTVQAERICTGWKYAMIRRVMQAARAADRIEGAAEAVDGSVEALAVFDSVTDTDQALEIIKKHKTAGITPTAATVKAMADTRPKADKDKATRDATRRKEQHIAGQIKKDLYDSLKKLDKMDPTIRVLVGAALVKAAKWQYGPLTSGVVKAEVKAYNDRLKKESTPQE